MKLAHRTTNNWLPSLLDEMLAPDYKGGAQVRNFLPAVNVLETEEHFKLQLVIPGFTKEEVSLELDKDVLTIASALEENIEVDAEKFTRKEFSKQSFKRSFNLPDSINQDLIEANYENGILTLVLPKKEEAKPQPKRVIALK